MNRFSLEKKTQSIWSYDYIIIFDFFSDLSNCQLKQIPDAIYFMIEKRNMELTACNLSSNIITKIPPKFPTSFNLITGMKNYFHDPIFIQSDSKLSPLYSATSIFAVLWNLVWEIWFEKSGSRNLVREIWFEKNVSSNLEFFSGSRKVVDQKKSGFIL